MANIIGPLFVGCLIGLALWGFVLSVETFGIWALIFYTLLFAWLTVWNVR